MAETQGKARTIPRAAESSVPTHARHFVIVLTLLLAGVAYLDRVCIATSAPRIMADLHMTHEQMGYVFSAFTFAYALLEIPSGWLADRFGPRLMLTRVVVWWSVMTAVTGWAGGFASLFAVRLLFGMGEAGCYPSISRAYARWLPVQERGRAFGISVTTGALGGAVTPILVVWMLDRMSWRQIFPLFGCVGLLWAMVWYWWFRDDPHHHKRVNPEELRRIGTDPPVPHPKVPWLSLVRNRNLILLCLMYGGTIYGWYFYLTWVPDYLMNVHKYDLKHAGWLSSLPLLGIAVGVFSGGWLSDMLRQIVGLKWGRRLPGLIGTPLAALCIVAAITTKVPIAAALLLASAACLAALGVAPCWVICLDIGGTHAGVVTGAMNMFGNLGGTLSPVVTGVCVQRLDSWNLPLITVAVFYLLAAACWAGIDSTKPIPNT